MNASRSVRRIMSDEPKPYNPPKSKVRALDIMRQIHKETGRFPNPAAMTRILLAAGWTHPTIARWLSPDGKSSYLGVHDAWRAYSAQPKGAAK